MKNFCTLFDSYYIQKGLALYRSLEAVCDDFTLYVMAFDEPTYEVLVRLGAPHLVVERETGPFLTEELARCKTERKRNEYCWTCGSAVTRYFLTAYGLDHIVYVDADMMFFHDPQPLFDGLEGASVGLSPHFTDEALYGKYCVQFVYFRADETGLAALSWWRERCIEWCYDRYENGLFGDQAYLDRMPGQFPGVREITDRGCGVAPWNCDQYGFPGGATIRFEGREIPVWFFHFHGISVELRGGKVYIRSKKRVFPQPVLDTMFQPYGELLTRVYREDLGLPVDGVVIRNPALPRRILQWLKGRLRDNRLVRSIYCKYIKGHTGYNKKQV